MVKELAWFTPWPPLPNGIADYSYRVVRELAARYQVIAYTDMAAPRLPSGVISRSVKDGAELSDEVCPVYQIGNNLDHGFVYRQAIRHPGIVVLHDLSLLYLVENLGLDKDTFYQELLKANPVIAPLRAADIAAGLGTYKADHSLFRMLNTLVERSRGVIVHTQYAKNILVRTLGLKNTDHINIIPHFAISPDDTADKMVRTRLAIPKDVFLIVTSGFATPVKRFDWLIEALTRVVKTNRRLMWVQAGPTRPEEYDLQELVAQIPELARVTRFTGYLPEEELDAYISAANLFVNLRYPSVGESSGSLARALAAGVACVVTDTAGYRELPSSILFKVSPENATSEIEELLMRGMVDPTAFDTMRHAAREYALNDLSIERYTRDFERVIDETMSSPQKKPTANSVLAPSAEATMTRLGPFQLNELGFGSLIGKVQKGGLRIRKEDSGWYVEVIRKA